MLRRSLNVSKLNTLLARAVYCVGVSICLCAAHAAAQTQPAQQPGAPPAAATPSPVPSPVAAENATRDPDLSITANVTARELRFEVVPTPKVEFPGRPRRDTVWEAERTNLPPQVQPGVTYRDIGIRLRITSVFADIERIVAEALGEIPASDDTQPKTDSNENVQLNSGGNAPPPAGDAQTTSATAQPVVAIQSISSTQTSPATSLTQTSPAPSSSQSRRARGRSSGSARARRGRL
jgi:hypothetical protein